MTLRSSIKLGPLVEPALSLCNVLSALGLVLCPSYFGSLPSPFLARLFSRASNESFISEIVLLMSYYEYDVPESTSSGGI